MLQVLVLDQPFRLMSEPITQCRRGKPTQHKAFFTDNATEEAALLKDTSRTNPFILSDAKSQIQI
jgi:hypothetical protein